MPTVIAAASLYTLKMKQEPSEYSSVACVGTTLLPHTTVKQEQPDTIDECLQSAAIIAASTGGSEGWWRDYVTLAEPKHDITGHNEVSLLRSFKRHPITKSFTSPTVCNNNTSTNICSNTNSPQVIHNITTTAPSTTPTGNSTRTSRNNTRSSSVKSEGEIATSTGEVYVSEGIVTEDVSSSCCISQQTTTTVTNTRLLRSNKGNGSNSSGPSVRSSLRCVRIKEEPVDLSGACAMEIEAALKCETVTVKEEPQDPDEPVWLGDITPDGHYSCTGDAVVASTTPVKQDGGDMEEEEENNIQDMEEDDVDLEYELNTRSRRRIRSLTQKIRRSRLKSFRKEKPGKMRTRSSGLTGSSSSSQSAAAAEFNPFRYQCPFCPFNTGYIVQMKRHRIRHMADGALNCKRCEYTTKSKQQYKEHLIQHYQADTDSEEDSEEEEDDETEGGAPDYQDGVTDQSGNKDLFTYHQPLPSVLPVIPGGKPTVADAVIVAPETKLFEKILDLRCKYCPFCTTYRSIMNQHRTIHQAEGVMYCPQCDLSTRDKEEYKEHLEKHYQRDSFSCEYCGYSTISQYLYINHRVKHTEKTYCCEDCSYTTGFKKAFKYHRLKHSAEKLLRCKHCPFITKYRHNYRQHMATHTGKGLMFCDFCSFYSAWETNFSRHLSRHKMEEEATKLEEQARLEAEMSFATKSK